MNQFSVARPNLAPDRFKRLCWPDVLAVVVLAFLIALFFHRLALSNLILGRGDTFLYFYPYWQAAADAIRAGRIPLWNPDLFMGAPFAANSQVGFFYPLNWPFWLLSSPPNAVKWSILFHLLLAGCGTYFAARRLLSLSRPASVMSGALFIFGGYLSAQVEHVNQLQGLAWLPWMFVILGSGNSASYWDKAFWRRAASFAVVLSLQFLAGHTQSTFISLIGILVWQLAVALAHVWQDGIRIGLSSSSIWMSSLARRFSLLVAGTLFGLLLSGVQLWPTLELVAASARRGGLPANEALSFSLHPLLLARSLLPTYGTALFSEYEASLPLSVLLLGILGGWHWREKRTLLLPILLATLGLFLALGIFNPIYLGLSRLPGFSFFRVPARWLVLYSFGASLLAGQGLQNLVGARPGGPYSFGRKTVAIAFSVIIALVVAAPISAFLSTYIPIGKEVTAEFPDTQTWLGWIVELLLLLYIMRNVLLPRWKIETAMVATVSLILTVTFVTSRTLPYNQLTAPEAFHDLRPPITLLNTLSECSPEQNDCRKPQDRFLSVSEIRFDLGDQAEIDSAYWDQLDSSELYDLTIATKQKEVINPNLSLGYDLSSVDGFDGGLLPLSNYSKWSQLILGPGRQTTDGRLREYLTTLPDADQVDNIDARFLITDKVGDIWEQGVFFDLQHPLILDADRPVSEIGFIPDFQATEIWLIAEGGGILEIETYSGENWTLKSEPNNGIQKAVWPEPARARSIKLMKCEREVTNSGDCSHSWTVRGISLVDNRDSSFQPLVVGEYRLVYSGDVKIYENLDAPGRSQLYYDWVDVVDSDAALDHMSAPNFDPEQQAVVQGLESPTSRQPGSGQVAFLNYMPERVEIDVVTNKLALLLLRDAFYPEWRATLDGESSQIYRVNILFRGILVPPGHHQVVMTYSRSNLLAGTLLTLVGLLFLVFIRVATGRV